MKFLFILNDTPYGSERNRNALHLARALCLDDGEIEVTVFLMGDSVICAKNWQSPDGGSQAPGRLLNDILDNRGRVLACATCMDARGFSGDELLMGVWLGTFDDAARMTREVDKVFVY
ncbi:DsrE family protein [Magnetovibrio sp. PR-2]|uniref:DsrE/DsrF/TusD sulfur relay family protein n=1 Tax=Magnetovibrio sp. PR-2 TaxID=3120356 RepID=UPI002FCDE2C7